MKPPVCMAEVWIPARDIDAVTRVLLDYALLGHPVSLQRIGEMALIRIYMNRRDAIVLMATQGRGN